MTDTIETPLEETPLTKTELRVRRAAEQRADAEKVRNEIAAATEARDAKTVRLRALRLAKEAIDREAASKVVKRPPARSRRAKAE